MRFSAEATRLSKAFSTLSSCTSNLSFTSQTLLLTLSLADSTCSVTSWRPLVSGAYRYTINVGGVATVDPRNPAVSESNGNAWSVVHVPGADFLAVADVPHGAVASVWYPSTTLGRTRRAHVYTPPGYESGQEKYPVF